MRFSYALLLLSYFTSTTAIMAQSDQPLIGMVLLGPPGTLNSRGVVEELRQTWQLEIDATEAGDTVSVLNVEGYTLAAGLIPQPIPGDEVQETAAYSYLWPEAGTEAVAHTGHVIVTLMNAGRDPVKENLLFTKLVAAVMKNSSAIGFYMGMRTLLIKKDFYLANTEEIDDQSLPLFNWLYFGLREDQGKRSVYTYGMADFGKSEMEIVDSKRTMSDLSEMLFNVSHYVIASDVTLNTGETVGSTADQKLNIERSKGKYLPGETLKIKY